MIDAKMTLDVQKNGVQKTVYIKEGETAGARRLIITLANNGKVVGVVGKTVFCYIKRPTATNLVTDATHVDDDTNTIIFDVPSLSEGTYYLELVVQDSSANQIYSPTFCIIAEDALYTSASGSFSPNTAYIVVTDDNFYTEAEVDDLLEDKQDVLTAGDNITIDDGVISADGSGLYIELEKTGTNQYSTTVTVDEITAALMEGSSITIFAEGVFPKVCKPSYISYTIGGSGFTAWKLGGLYSFSSSSTKYYQFEFKSSEPGVVTYSETTLTVPSQGSIASSNTGYVTGGDAYTALSAKEKASNKVTSISASSTNTQYPSAKCVYDAIQASGGSEPDFVVTATGNDFLKGEMTGGISVTLSTSKTLTELLAKAAAHEEFDVKGTIYVEDSDPEYAEEGVFDVQKYDLWYYRYGTADYINYLLGELNSDDTTERPGIALVFQHTFPRGSNQNVCFDRYAAWAIIVYESESTPGTISYEYTDDLSNLL